MTYNQLVKALQDALNEEGIIGSISELYDSKKPHLPKGAVAQGWSVAEVTRIILERYFEVFSPSLSFTYVDNR